MSIVLLSLLWDCGSVKLTRRERMMTGRYGEMPDDFIFGWNLKDRRCRCFRATGRFCLTRQVLVFQMEMMVPC